MAYFDNAATAYPKPEQVYSFMDEFYRNCGVSVGRGNYELSNTAKGITEDTRKRLKNILRCPAKQIIFTPTATIALNIIIQGMIETGLQNVYITPFEHNAVTRILHHYEKCRKIKVRELCVTNQLEYDLQSIKRQFDSMRPDFVIISHASNVIGLVAPAEEIFTLSKKYGAVNLLDMAQTAGLIDTNTGLETVDFAVFAGHKTLMGPSGISGFAMNPSMRPVPVLFGGTGYDSANQDMPGSIPERYEMGTLNISGIAGLNAAVRWIESRTMKALFDDEVRKREYLLSLLGQYDFLSIVGNAEGRKYVGIVSCLMDGISSDSAGIIFAEHGIAVRAGLQCAPSAHKFLNTYPAGTIRFSVNSLTQDKDFQELENALDLIGNEL